MQINLTLPQHALRNHDSIVPSIRSAYPNAAIIITAGYGITVSTTPHNQDTMHGVQQIIDKATAINPCKECQPINNNTPATTIDHSKI